MTGGRRWQILALIVMALVGVVLGVWLFRAGFTVLGCVYVTVFLWRGQQFALWLIAPSMAPSDVILPMSSRLQRFLLSIICLFGGAVSAIGVYLWRVWPEEWQAGVVFVLFGFLVLAPVTVKEIQFRRKALDLVRRLPSRPSGGDPPND
ncbi:MAG TPA: hypothetical protein VK788_01060 [Terriglobales bacterium]|jgi:hypothetical protein|nr:hypothetical protein [Terriglobales bacterium]